MQTHKYAKVRSIWIRRLSSTRTIHFVIFFSEAYPGAVEFDISRFDPQDAEKTQLLRDLIDCISSGRIPTYNIEIQKWEAIEAFKIASFEDSSAPGLKSVSNGGRVRDASERRPLSESHKTDKEALSPQSPFHGMGVETVHMAVEDEDSEDEIEKYLETVTPDLFSTAAFNSTGSSATPSGSSGTLTDLSSSPPRYSPVKSSLPATSGDDGVFNGLPQKVPEVIFTDTEMVTRRNDDFELADRLRKLDEEDVFIDKPESHPAWPDAKEIHPRLVPYDCMHPSLCVQAPRDAHPSLICGIAPGAFRTLKANLHRLSVLRLRSDKPGVVPDPPLTSTTDSGELCQKLPEFVRKKDALIPSTLGILYPMWNSRLGLIWMVAQTAVITCQSCWLVRTFDADLEHHMNRRKDGTCIIEAARAGLVVGGGGGVVAEGGDDADGGAVAMSRASGKQPC
ncbi:hypothetical protein L218DRAFT_1006280 [Marasmius fiardii PR-910]|nr:hypothetical protein L218DRAFT_1006280 [Marasmius fiardii PR-910]